MKTLKVQNKNKNILKFIGLIDRRNKKPIFFMTRFGIHTYFMRYPIQLLILDDNNILIKSIVLNPNRIYFWNPFYHRIVEIPLVTGDEKFDIGVGERLFLKFI